MGIDHRTQKPHSAAMVYSVFTWGKTFTAYKACRALPRFIPSINHFEHFHAELNSNYPSLPWPYMYSFHTIHTFCQTRWHCTLYRPPPYIPITFKVDTGLWNIITLLKRKLLLITIETASGDWSMSMTLNISQINTDIATRTRNLTALTHSHDLMTVWTENNQSCGHAEVLIRGRSLSKITTRY